MRRRAALMVVVALGSGCSDSPSSPESGPVDDRSPPSLVAVANADDDWLRSPSISVPAEAGEQFITAVEHGLVWTDPRVPDPLPVSLVDVTIFQHDEGSRPEVCDSRQSALPPDCVEEPIRVVNVDLNKIRAARGDELVLERVNVTGVMFEGDLVAASITWHDDSCRTSAATNLTREPPYRVTHLFRFVAENGCYVRLDHVAWSQPGPHFHCAPWPTTVTIGSKIIDHTPIGSYVRDPPDSTWIHADALLGYTDDATLPDSAIDTTLSHGEFELWLDPADSNHVWLHTPTTTERLPRSSGAYGCD